MNSVLFSPGGWIGGNSSAISTATKDRIKVMYRLNSDEIGML